MVPHLNSPVARGCRIHWLHCYGGVRLPQRVSCDPVARGCRIHWLHCYRGVKLPQRVSCGPVARGCRIHWLHCYRGVRFPQRVSCGPVARGCRIRWLHCYRGARGSRIHRLHLYRRVRHPFQPVSSIKQSEGKVSVLELGEMKSTPSLPSLPGPLRSGVVEFYQLVKQNCLIPILCANEWLMLNLICPFHCVQTNDYWIVSDTKKYLETFNCAQ